jgi:hypothetical protein
LAVFKVFTRIWGDSKEFLYTNRSFCLINRFFLLNLADKLNNLLRQRDEFVASQKKMRLNS